MKGEKERSRGGEGKVREERKGGKEGEETEGE